MSEMRLVGGTAVVTTLIEMYLAGVSVRRVVDEGDLQGCYCLRIVGLFICLYQ